MKVLHEVQQIAREEPKDTLVGSLDSSYEVPEHPQRARLGIGPVPFLDALTGRGKCCRSCGRVDRLF